MLIYLKRTDLIEWFVRKYSVLKEVYSDDDDDDNVENDVKFFVGTISEERLQLGIKNLIVGTEEDTRKECLKYICPFL